MWAVSLKLTLANSCLANIRSLYIVGEQGGIAQEDELLLHAPSWVSLPSQLLVSSLTHFCLCFRPIILKWDWLF